MTVISDDYSADVIALRVPEWCRRAPVYRLNGSEITPDVHNGYAYFSVGKRFTVEADFPIEAAFVRCGARGAHAWTGGVLHRRR